MELIVNLANFCYLVAATLFIVGLKRMSKPSTAVLGNLLGAGGMLLAILATLIQVPSVPEATFAWNVIGITIGAAIGGWLATATKMTAMPQMVALLNGFGGAASVFVAWGDLLQHETAALDVLVATAASCVIGAVTFWGSLIAYGKLEEFAFMRKLPVLPQQQVINAGLAAAALVLSILLCTVDDPSTRSALYLATAIVSSVLGLLLVNPIGGADMPVVIALLNSYSGLAACATGFVINNNALIVTGSLVGASGVILTQIMCKAMNRSMFNVVFGVMEAGMGGPKADDIYATVRSTSADDVALILENAQRVVIVPGYGMAVAQAQHAVRDLAKLLEARGCAVEYAIHPVAGRMPGHMNVLLAEADISYELLREMDDINPTLPTADVCLVIGANDTVNPLARTDPKCPIAGMPIIDADKARTVIVIKRSLSPGFAGIPNPLFAAPNALMYYGDGQKAIRDIISALKSA
ncbi:MAG: NAD(P)(+) transhydrogenase (Re/Si-specific) subunit beta [Pirellulaceae bacterium]